jgi:hypothetical protein
MLVSGGVLATVPASPAQADPDCNNGGYYVLFVRGSGEKINDIRADRFYWSLIGSQQYPGSLGHLAGWAELGNLDGSQDPGEDPDSPGEYPASPVPWSNITGQYYNSVTIGVSELVNHLNHRYAPGPVGKGCLNETLVLGGYSQGADVIGYAIQWVASYVRDNIGYVALYGDPRYMGNFGTAWSCYVPPWAMVGTTCNSFLESGVLGGRWPYRPDWIAGRLGSWCDGQDGICNGSKTHLLPPLGSHNSAYQNYWMPQSAGLIATYAKHKRNALNPSLPAVAGGTAPPWEPTIASMPLPPSWLVAGATWGGFSDTASSITPTAISRSERTMDVFYRDTDGDLVNLGWDTDFGWGYQWWPDDLAGNPVAVARKPEAMDVFYRKADGSLWNRGWDVSTGWQAPVQLIGSGVAGDPAVISRAPGEMDVFWRSTNNELKNVHWDWQVGWGNVVTRTGTGTVYSNPTVTSRRADLMDVFYRNANNQLVNIGWKAADGWYAPQVRCSGIAGHPVAINRKLTAMSVFYREVDGDLAECMWDGNVGWGYQAWAASMVGDPAAIARGENRMNVFYRQANGILYNRWWDTSTGWQLQSWSDNLTGNPAAVTHSETTMVVFFREGNNGLSNRGWDSCCGWLKQGL